MAVPSPWLVAIRPKTLPAGAMPVVVGSALAFTHGVFQPLPAVVALFCALLMQISSNLINDLYDFRKGADTRERLGPPRAVASGLLSERQVSGAAWIAVLTAFILGQYLVYVGGWQIFAIGVVSLVAAWAYTGGPLPLAYLGLGEVCAFVFFGIIPVCGTYFVQAHTLPTDVLVMSTIPGMFAANILAVNNIRDIPTDTSANKRTLAVRIGSRAARLLYCFLTFFALSLPIGLWLWLQGGSLWLLLTLLSLPFAVRACRAVLHAEGAALNGVLVQTVQLLIIHSILMSIALVLMKIFVV